MHNEISSQINELKKGAINIMAQIENLENISNGEKYKGIINEDMSTIEVVNCITQLELERKEARMDKQDKTIKMLIGVILSIILIIVGTVVWLFSNYDFYIYNQDIGTGNANFIGGNGDITNGEANSNLGQTEEQTD